MTVTAPDDHTVQCVLPVSFAPFLRSMGTAIYPKHILEKHVDDGTFASTWDIDTYPSEIIGTGPFTIERYVPGERVVMRRNPDYWLKDDAGNSLPYLDEVIRVIVPDFEAELAKFLAGEADSHGVLGEELAELGPLQEEGNFTIYRRGPAFGTTFLGFNMNPGKNPDTDELYIAPEKLEWFRNKQFRQAIAHSIDKDAIINDRAQEIAAENVPVIYTTLSERLSAVRNVFGNITPTLYALWDIRYLYRTDQEDEPDQSELIKDDPVAYTKAFVQRAIQRYERDGRQATIDYYNSTESVDGEWYVFIIDQDGFTISHHNPQFRGRDPSLRVDATGYFYGDELLGATEEGRWVDYVILNPETGENEQKHTWAVRHEGLLFGSGWYEQ